MTKEEYKQLNDYLNIIFKELEKRDNFLLENLSPISNMDGSFIDFANQYEFRENGEEIYLPFAKLWEIAQEIIGSFSQEYLEYFNRLLSDGTIEFNYDKDGTGSWQQKQNDKIIIEVERKFTYNDVIILLHEFIHYMNDNIGPITINRYLFTEFLSIYFEIYAQQYLIKYYKIPNNSLGIDFRMEHIKRASMTITFFSIPFYTYSNIGYINENSYELVRKFLSNITEENFDKKCNLILQKCKIDEQEYRTNIMYEKQFDEDEFASYLVRSSGLTSSYKYLLGTVLAYYAIDNVNIKNIIELNNFINSDESADMSPVDLLYKFGINLNSNFMEIAFDTISKIIEDKKKTR